MSDLQRLFGLEMSCSPSFPVSPPLSAFVCPFNVGYSRVQYHRLLFAFK